MSEIEERLEELERLGLSRRLRLISGPQGPRVLLDGRPVLLLCSNNYLGLADHPRVREAAAEAAMRWGVGAGASRLVSGTMTVHRRLEERLAAFKGSESCVLFGSGYLANLGAIGALAGPGDAVFSDELNHASIVDGCRASRARVHVYRHFDTEHLAWSLRRHGGSGRRLVATDSVFSMDGDLAPLGEIVELARAHRARMLVDEAHATGALGPGGRGAVAQAGPGGRGGRARRHARQGARLLRRVRVRDRGDGALPRQHRAAADLLHRPRPPGRSRRARGAGAPARAPPPRASACARTPAPCAARSPPRGSPCTTATCTSSPWWSATSATRWRSARARVERGVFAQAIRPPSVPAGTARLRLTAMASHTPAELRRAARVLAEAARAQGLEPAELPPPDAPRRAGSDPERGEPAEEVEEAPDEHRLGARARGLVTASAPFDVEHATEPLATPRSSNGPHAPFDIEREDSLTRAA